MNKLKEIIFNWLEDKFSNKGENKNSSLIMFQIYNNCNNDNRNMNDEIIKEINNIKEKINDKYKSFGKTMIIQDGEIVKEYDF